MDCFITGATGFIGRYVVRELLAREGPDAPGTMFILVRSGSEAKLAELREWWGPRAARIAPLAGDVRAAGLGLDAGDRARLQCVPHVFHLAALYDIEASPEHLEEANVAGTRNVLELAREVQAGCFHLVSSIAAAGRYPGVFTEDMFGEAVGLEHPYFRTKHESEALVRGQTETPWRIYRPGMVIGDSQTGHITKIDGPYYFFKLLQRWRDALPSWAPLVGFEGGYVNVVPVDFVAKALVHLAFIEGQDRRCFHLIDPKPRRAGPLLNVFARAAHAPEMTLRLDASLLALAPRTLTDAFQRAGPLRTVIDELLAELRLPRAVLEFLNLPTLYDNARARALLAPAGVEPPPLESYAWRVWDYWERRLDPDLSVEQSLARAVSGKRVLITGAAAGIGYAAAARLCAAGASVLLVDRDAERLASAQNALASEGGQTYAYECDLVDEAACARLIAAVNAAHGGVDVLINNAGHSIRRSIDISFDRVHDYQRLMALNYFAAVRLTLAFLPGMAARRNGHVIASSSLGVLASQPRFSAYIASKAALEAFTRSASAEYRDRGVRFTVINFPLVRTAMSAPTGAFRDMRMLSPEEAAERIVQALVERPARIVTPLGRLAQAFELFAPGLLDLINNAAFQMYPDSAAARGLDAPDEPPTQDALDFARIVRGVHWGRF